MGKDGVQLPASTEQLDALRADGATGWCMFAYTDKTTLEFRAAGETFADFVAAAPTDAVSYTVVKYALTYDAEVSNTVRYALAHVGACLGRSVCDWRR